MHHVMSKWRPILIVPFFCIYVVYQLSLGSQTLGPSQQKRQSSKFGKFAIGAFKAHNI
jgi:hypothetical protein